MSGLLPLWEVVKTAAALAELPAFALLTYVRVRKHGFALWRNSESWRPSRALRFVYHHCRWVYLTSAWVDILGDGYQAWDTVFLAFCTWIWWDSRTDDDWDDEDRRALREGFGQRVERFGNRLRLSVAPAPAT